MRQSKRVPTHHHEACRQAPRAPQGNLDHLHMPLDHLKVCQLLLGTLESTWTTLWHTSAYLDQGDLACLPLLTHTHTHTQERTGSGPGSGECSSLARQAEPAQPPGTHHHPHPAGRCCPGTATHSSLRAGKAEQMGSMKGGRHA